MADSVVNSLSLLKNEMKAADANLKEYIERWGTLGAGIRKAVEDGGGSIDKLMEKLSGKSQKDRLKLQLLLEMTDENGKPLTKQTLQRRIDELTVGVEKGMKEVKIGGMTFTGTAQMQEYINQYKMQMQLLGKTAQEQYDLINRLVSAPKKSAASKEWREQTQLANEAKKAASEAQNEYIQWTQRVQALNAQLTALQRKLTEQQNKQVGTDYKSEQSKANAIAKTNKGIEKTKAAIDQATVSQQKFAAAVVATSGGRKLNLIQSALGVEASATKEMNQAINRQVQIQRQLIQLRKEYNQLAHRQTLTNAEADVFNRTKNKIKELIGEMKRLNNEQKGSYGLGRQITDYDRLKQKIKDVNEETKKTKEGLLGLPPVLSKIATAFGITFSAQSLVQFGKKIIETRGIFEQQFVAMKQIIGDVDQATKIWNQTMQQALQSPFRAMQLVDYTKKLAAYRIETDKLFDTTKRLADVASGLGVDMGRLILAYGQVKTANYLRASEVRQFTEAGVNIYGELAKYFSEMEGHMVSTADMVERVSKRMVLFSDVEEIFKRMTDEGGAFFDMQRVQSETVRGQIQKLHDAYDQMLNAIGEDNQGTIKDLVERLNDLVKHWRDVVFFLKAAVVAWGAYRIAVALASKNTLTYVTTNNALIKSLLMTNTRFVKLNGWARRFGITLEQMATKSRFAAVAVHGLGKAFTLLKAATLFILIDIFAHLATELTEGMRAAHQLRKELDDIVADKTQGLEDEIARFEALREKIENVAEGTQERRDLIEEMNSKYGQYLNNLLTESMTLDEMAKAYENVESKMRSFAAARAQEEIQQRLMKETLEEQKKLSELLTGKKIYRGKEEGYIKLKDTEAQDIAKLFTESLFKGEQKELTDIIKEYLTSSEATIVREKPKYMVAMLRYLYSEYQRYQNISFNKAASTREERERLEEQKKLYDKEVRQEEEKYKAKIKAIKGEQLTTEQVNAAMEKEQERHGKAMTALAKKYDQPLPSQPGELNPYEQNYNERLQEALNYNFNSSESLRRYRLLRSTLDNTQMGSTQRDKSIAEAYERATENLKVLQNRKNSGGNITQQEIDKAKEEVEDWRLAARLRGIDLTKGKNGSKIYRNFNDIIQLVETLNSEFEKLSDAAYDSTTAAEMVKKSYAQAIADILGGLLDLDTFDFTSKEGVRNAFQEIADTLTSANLWGMYGKDIRDLQNKMQKKIGTADVKIGVSFEVKRREDFAKDLERMFSDYELTLEMQQLDVPQNVAEDLFGFGYVTLADLQKRMDKFVEDNNGMLSGKELEEYQKYADKISAELLKKKKEHIKEYGKFLEREYSEQAKLEMEYARDRAFILTNFTDADQANNILRQREEKFNDDINALRWETFKESDFYVDMMNDLTSLPSDYTQVLLDKINEILKEPDKLDSKALKEAIKARERILQMQMDVNPLKSMNTSIKNVRDYIRNPENNIKSKSFAGVRKEVEARMIATQTDINTFNEQINALKELQGQVVAYEKATKDAEEAQSSFNNEINKAITLENGDKDLGAGLSYFEKEQAKVMKELDDLRKIPIPTPDDRTQISNLERRKKELDNYIDSLKIAIIAENTLRTMQKPDERTSTQLGIEIGEMEDKKEKSERENESYKNILSELKRVSDSLTKFNEKLNQTIGNVKNAGEALYNMFDALGGETDVLTDEWKSFGGSMLDTITQALTMIPLMVAAFTTAGIAINSALGIIGLVAEGITIIANAVIAFAKLHDAHYEKEIEDQQEKIDALKDAYEELQKVIKKTLSSADYMANYDATIDNINEQIERTQAQLNAERSKKNPDKEKIKELEKNVEELKESAEEAAKALSDTFLGFNKDNFKDITRDFVDAWLDAYKETGDGYDALMEQFQSKMEQWFVNQAIMRVVGKAMEPLLEQMVTAVDKYSETGSAASLEEINDVWERAQLTFSQVNDAMKPIASMFRVGGDGSLSGLAQGIQGMSEETADVLAGYWNSVRQYTANIDLTTMDIRNILQTNFNPMLQQVSIIANNMIALRSLMESTAINNGQGRGFRVYSV